MKGRIIKLWLIFLTSVNVHVVNSQSIEQNAINYFADSVIHKKDPFWVDMGTDQESFNLLPPDMDESLLTNGLFTGQKIYWDGIIRNISSPYYDSLNIAASEGDFYSKDDRQVFVEYVKDWKRKKDLLFTPFALQLPNKIVWFNPEEFECNESYLFLKVNSHLSSFDTYAVEIVVYDKEYDSHYEFYIFLDKHEKVVNWLYK